MELIRRACQAESIALAQGDQAEIEYVLTPIDFKPLERKMALYDSWCMGLKVWWAAAVDLAHLF